MLTSSNAFRGNLLSFQIYMGILGGLTFILNICCHIHDIPEFSFSAFVFSLLYISLPHNFIHPLKIPLQVF